MYNTVLEGNYLSAVFFKIRTGKNVTDKVYLVPYVSVGDQNGLLSKTDPTFQVTTNLNPDPTFRGHFRF